MSSVMSQMVKIQLHRFDEVAPFVDEKPVSASLEPDQKNRWVNCYAAIETTPEESSFGIVVVGCE